MAKGKTSLRESQNFRAPRDDPVHTREEENEAHTAGSLISDSRVVFSGQDLKPRTSDMLRRFLITFSWAPPFLSVEGNQREGGEF